MRLGRVVVGGHSMRPALEHGDRLVYVSGAPRVGDVCVATDPRAPGRWIVKRVAAVDDGAVTLASDLAGHERLRVPAGAIVGRAVLRYRPLGRFGRI
ncbi:MAG TPA: S26 family signal peptidase [Candidatus Limnocylindria bacterium]|nr:S26 family signal peptidase [Candidatus Limnocylindria bacterium]